MANPKTLLEEFGSWEATSLLAVVLAATLGCAGLWKWRPSRMRRNFRSSLRNLAKTSGLTLEEAEMLFEAAERIRPISDRPFPGGAAVSREWLATHLRSMIFQGSAKQDDMKLASGVALKIDPPDLRPPGAHEVIRSLDEVELSFPFLNLCLPGQLGLFEGRKLGVFVGGSWPSLGLETGDRVILRACNEEFGCKWLRSGTVIRYLGGETPYVEIDVDATPPKAERRGGMRIPCRLPLEVFPESPGIEMFRRELAEPASKHRNRQPFTFGEILENLPDYHKGRNGTARNFSPDGLMIETAMRSRVGEVLLIAIQWSDVPGGFEGLLRCRVVRSRREESGRLTLHLSILDASEELKKKLESLTDGLRELAKKEEVGTIRD